MGGAKIPHDLGYSWLTNQYGLTIDTVVEFELVKPDGQAANITQASDPELFFGLKVSQLMLFLHLVVYFCDKGGLNNFVHCLEGLILNIHSQ